MIRLSARTVKTYIGWIKRPVLWVEQRPPSSTPQTAFPLTAALLLSLGCSHALGAQLAICQPVVQRAGGALGCFITARQELGPLPRDTALYWHIDAFRARSTAENADGPRATVVESDGQVWLFSIGAREWRSQAGTRVASIGPLPVIDAQSLAAVFAIENLGPGMRSPVHRHPGIEVRYTLEGESCLESPNGRVQQRAGAPGAILPAGIPMQVRSMGTQTARSLILLLEDATKRRAVPVPNWSPANLCDS